MPLPRSVGFVLTLAFVFASTAFLVPGTAAQSSASLSGMVCATPQDNYPRPVDSSGSSCSYYGMGLPGATVRLTKPGPVNGVTVGAVNQTTTTAEDGSFSFSGMPAGNYTLTVNRTGFSTVTQAITLRDGSQRQDISLAGQTVTASGRITSSAGAAISGAEVQLCCSPQEVRVRTGADGRFSASVTAGWMSVYVQAPGYQAQGDHLLVDGSKPLDRSLEPVPPTDAVIRGVLRDQDGAPVEGARVSAYTYGGGCGYAEPVEGDGVASSPPCEPYATYSGENFTFSDAQGAYRLGVYSGEGSMSVHKEGHASYSFTYRIAAGDEQVKDLTVKKYPEKTARIEGRITDGGSAVRYAHVSVNSPEFGMYECSTRMSGSGSGSGTSGSDGTPEPAKPTMADSSYYYDPGACAITVNDDGTYEGLVTPGYNIIQVHVDSYSACSESRDSDGSSSRTCGPEYYQWTRTVDLPADETTRVDVALRARPAPDATVSGYLVDSTTGQAIPGGQISFSNMDSYGHGYARTDEDGSFSIRLRSGYHAVYAYAEGYLHWEGTIDLSKGGNDVDVVMTPGQESHGCCWTYASGSDYAHAAETSAAGGPMPPSMAGDMADEDRSAVDSGGEDALYEDLGGGLGPYDADERQRELGDAEGNGAPAPGLALAALALAGAALVLRRRKA